MPNMSERMRALLMLLCLLCAAAVPAGAQQPLSETDGRLLLRIARDTLVEFLNRQTLPPLSRYGVSGPLQEKCGVFVTLKDRRTRDLRGCIGYIVGHKELAAAVADCTVFAATRDLRFQPMRAGEEQTVVIEISVLSPPRRITGIDEIRVGTHGLLLTQGMKSGVLLPQVPVEQHWGREEFLQAVCRKADLPDRAWEHGAVLSVFTAQIFSEQAAAH